jgi:class 3 adenylate cyclase
MLEIGQRIRSQREKRGLKQNDIASALQLSPQAVSKWERGETCPDLAILAPLARLLGVSTDWLLNANGSDRDVFEASVIVCDVSDAYKKSIEMPPRDYATWVNGYFFQLTEAVLRYDGIPVKYVGDGFLGFFSGVNHAQRALRTAALAKQLVTEKLSIAISSGDIFLGAVGHPDYARPDIMGEAVNIAFLALRWANENTGSKIAATGRFIEQLPEQEATLGKRGKIDFLKGSGNPTEVFEIQEMHVEGDKTLSTK